MRNILSLYLSFYDKEKRIWADFFLYIFRNLAKNAKKSPIFSRRGGSHDQNGLNFTFFEISNNRNYSKKEIKVIATFTHILWFFEKNVIFLLSIHSLYKNAIWAIMGHKQAWGFRWRASRLGSILLEHKIYIISIIKMHSKTRVKNSSHGPPLWRGLTLNYIY